jgi:hypothetical protein
MVWAAPLLILVLPLLIIYSAASIYRSIYPFETIRRALDVVAEYRILKREAQIKKTKRIAKKLAAMESDYKRARSLILRSTGVKLLLLISGYMAGSVFFLIVSPLLPSPYNIPILSFTHEGAIYTPGFLLYFLMFIAYYLVFRDSFI